MQKQVEWFQNKQKKSSASIDEKRQEEKCGTNNQTSGREIDDIVGRFFYCLNQTKNSYEKCNVLEYDETKKQYKVRNINGEIFFLQRKFLYLQEEIEEFIKK